METVIIAAMMKKIPQLFQLMECIHFYNYSLAPAIEHSSCVLVIWGGGGGLPPP